MDTVSEAIDQATSFSETETIPSVVIRRYKSKVHPQQQFDWNFHTASDERIIGYSFSKSEPSSLIINTIESTGNYHLRLAGLNGAGHSRPPMEIGIDLIVTK